MKKIISVTALEIREGRKRSCYHCPVALALRRTLGYPEGFAGVDECRVAPDVWIPTPRNVTAFMLAFDKGHPVKPFRFTVEVPE